MNKSNLQDIELSVFERLKSKKDFPLWWKIGSGVLGLLVILFLLSMILFPGFDPNKNVENNISPTPTVIKQEKSVSEDREQWRSIKTELENHDPLQKELLPPEINLEIQFENE